MRRSLLCPDSEAFYRVLNLCCPVQLCRLTKFSIRGFLFMEAIKKAFTNVFIFSKVSGNISAIYV